MLLLGLNRFLGNGDSDVCAQRQVFLGVDDPACIVDAVMEVSDVIDGGGAAGEDGDYFSAQAGLVGAFVKEGIGVKPVAGIQSLPRL